MHIEKDIKIVDLGLHIKAKKMLVISDVHIGYEGELHRKGMLIPKFLYRDIVDRVGQMILQTNPGTIIITGDLKHEFGRISEQEWRDVLRFIDFLAKQAKKIVLIKGNHDAILAPIARKRQVKVVDHYGFNLNSRKVYICHGDAIPVNQAFRSSDIIIIGHEHPAVSIKDGVRSEKFKCFLKGNWKNRLLLALPSLNLAHEGTDLLAGRLLSPFLQGNISNFEVYVANLPEPLHFGKLKNLHG